MSKVKVNAVGLTSILDNQSTDLGDSGATEDDAARSSECPESGDVRRCR